MLISQGLRDPRGSLFHGCSRIREFFRSLLVERTLSFKAADFECHDNVPR
jgi:hypothetical protein